MNRNENESDNVIDAKNEENANGIETNIELPIIITSSASCCSDTDLLSHPNRITIGTYNNETSFISYNGNNTDQLSIMRSPSPSNLNASGASRGNVRRWSQSLSSGAKAKQQKAIKTINCMPSRLQKLPTALSLDGQFSIIGTNDRVVDHFVREIEQHNYLLEDSPTGEQLRNSTLRALPQPLRIKRQIKSKIELTVLNKSRQSGVNRWKRAIYHIGIFNNKAKQIVHKAIVNGELWYESMKEIEGHFGGGVGTYFQFLRFLFVLNFLSMVTVLCFIVLPQILKNYLRNDNDPQIFTATYEALTNPFDYITAESFPPEAYFMSCSKMFLNWIISDHILDFCKRVWRSIFRSVLLAWIWLVLASWDVLKTNGHLENSILFYGSYSTEVKGTKYSLPYAYLMTMVCLYVATFIILSVSMAKSYRTSFIETSGGESMSAHEIFCSWDFRISNEKAAEMKKYSIYNELKFILDNVCDSVEIRSKRTGFWVLVTQISANVFVFGILCGVGYFVWTLLHTTINMESNSSLIVPTIVMFTMLALQTMFERLAFLESYKSPRVTLNISLIRNYLLEILIISPLLVFWISRSKKGQCWETAIGQEIYRFVIIDFFLVGCGGALYHMTRFLIYKYVWPQIGLPEFNISRASLGLIFNQTLLWIGLFFSPTLGVVLIVKMIIVFYLKKIVLIHFCEPPSKLWRSAQTSTIFLAMTFVSLIGIIVALVYVLTQVHVSDICGPFRNHEFIFHVLRGDILKLQENHFVWRLVMFLIRPASIGGFLLTLCVIVYYLRSKSRARIAMVKMLKNMLLIEAKDKQYLLKRITRETRGKDWLFDDANKNNNSFGRRLNGLESYAEFYYEKRRNGELDSSSSSNGSTMRLDMLRQRRKS